MTRKNMLRGGLLASLALAVAYVLIRHPGRRRPD